MCINLMRRTTAVVVPHRPERRGDVLPLLNTTVSVGIVALKSPRTVAITTQFALKSTFAIPSTGAIVMAQDMPLPISAATISATDVSGLLARGSSPQRNNVVQIGKCPPPRTRRPRTPIALTEEDIRTLNADEIRKKKNRVSAQRDRDRKKQHVQDLEDMVCELWKRVQYLEGIITSMHPNQDMSGLYETYEPYAMSRSLQPLTEPAAGGLNEADMTELAWLLDSIPAEPM